MAIVVVVVVVVGCVKRCFKGFPVGGQTRVDLATLAFFPCFIGFFGPANGVNLIKTL